MNNGDADPLVRILSDDGSFEPAAPPPSEPRPKRWFAPILIVAGLLAVFFVVTRPDSSGTDDTIDPAPLSAVNAELVDLTSTSDVPATGEWEQLSIPARAVVNDMLTTPSLFIAAGTTTEGAQAWTTSTGTGWSPISALDRPGLLNSGIDHVALFNDELIALGTVDGAVSLWTAGLLPHWEHQGAIAAFEDVSIADLAAGKELLAITWPEGQVSAWLSSDGRDWRSIGRLHDLDGTSIIGIAANEDWYYAYGITDSDESHANAPAVHRSHDGVTWETSQFESPGLVIDLIAESDRLLATGWIESPAGITLAVWQSNDDGTTWTQIAGEEDAHQPMSISVEVHWTRTGDNPAAQMTIAGNLLEVTVGSGLMTDVGSMTVTEISDDSVSLRIGRHTLVAEIDAPQELAVHPSPRKIAAEGPRIVVVGYLVAENWQAPVVWASADGGQTWALEALPGPGAADYFVGSRGSAIVVLGNEGEAWRSTWTDDAASAVAIDAIARYLDALDRRDPEALAEVIPALMAVPEAARFQVPSLGWNHMMWWADSGELDHDRVADTLDYLKATAATMALGGDCTASVTLGSSDRASVSCPFTVESDLLTVFGHAGSEGRFRAAVNDGVIASVLLEPAPSAAMWSTLAGQIVDDDATGPEFNTTSALTHRTLAEQYVAALLLPGDTKTVETLFGTMEWSWLERPTFSSGAVPWIHWTSFGFVAVGYDGNEEDPRVSGWQSPDGTEWATLDLPDDIEGLWELHDYQGGLIGQVRRNDMSGLVYFDGMSWVDVPAPSPVASEEGHGFIAMAVGQDEILAVAGAWDDMGGVRLGEALLLDEALRPRPATLPAIDLTSSETTVEIAPSDSGFLLMARGTTPRGPISIWSMDNEEEWSLVAEDADRGDATNLYAMQRFGSLYFASGEISSIACGDSTNPAECWYRPSIWTSTDATKWNRVLTETGAVVAANSLGFGPLGFAAIDVAYVDEPQPRNVYLSHDGRTWETIADLALLDTRGSWWWFSPPAVGTDTIIITGSTYLDSNTEPTDLPVMIVGRLVDP